MPVAEVNQFVALLHEWCQRLVVSFVQCNQVYEVPLFSVL